MIYGVEYSPQFREDVREIAIWYADQKAGLDDEFLLSLEASVNLTGYNPFLFQPNRKAIRSSLLKRFPYKVYYSIENNIVVILGVFYSGRNPKFIAKRIQKK